MEASPRADLMRAQEMPQSFCFLNNTVFILRLHYSYCSYREVSHHPDHHPHSPQHNQEPIIYTGSASEQTPAHMSRVTA